ncbi:hypothetical protein EI94DRAFT_1736914 [Lactarius quietus]|nr:hypothetical protein EI94DRAFT_1736914 [Lactarius quietus]
MLYNLCYSATLTHAGSCSCFSTHSLRTAVERRSAVCGGPAVVHGCRRRWVVRAAGRARCACGCACGRRMDPLGLGHEGSCQRARRVGEPARSVNRPLGREGSCQRSGMAASCTLWRQRCVCVSGARACGWLHIMQVVGACGLCVTAAGGVCTSWRRACACVTAVGVLCSGRVGVATGVLCSGRVVWACQHVRGVHMWEPA